MEFKHIYLFPLILSILLLRFGYRNLNAAVKGEIDEPEILEDSGGEENMLCVYGHRQSPIALNDKKVEVQKHFVVLHRRYRITRATMVNRGHDIMLKFKKPVGGFRHGRTEFYLRQLHWHKPSEHTINGKRYALEMHMVHTTSNNNQTAAIAFLYKFGKHDPFLSKMERLIRAVSGVEGRRVDAGIVNPNSIREKYHGYYRYNGSLSTPPCTEGVLWTVMKEVRTVSKKQVRLLREATPHFRENARPTQKVEHLHLKYYKPPGR